MKHIALIALSLGAATPVAAQSIYNPGVATVLVPSYGLGRTASNYDQDLFLRSGGETPTMRRQKLDWAIALRNEALRLQTEDGGVISDDHARYISRRAKRLLFR